MKCAVTERNKPNFNEGGWTGRTCPICRAERDAGTRDFKQVKTRSWRYLVKLSLDCGAEREIERCACSEHLPKIGADVPPPDVLAHMHLVTTEHSYLNGHLIWGDPSIGEIGRLVGKVADTLDVWDYVDKKNLTTSDITASCPAFDVRLVHCTGEKK